MTNQLSITLEGPGVTDGTVPVAALVAALEGAQDAVRLMVEHLGERERSRGRPPQWVREQSALRLVGTRQGSLVADLVLDPPKQPYLDDLGGRALSAIRAWDGTEDSLPREVADRFYAAASAIPEDVQLWLGGPEDRDRVAVRRRPSPKSPRGPQAEEALLLGWLKEVNWDKGTAQLHDFHGDYVPLRFAPSLGDEMLRLATKYIEVRGSGSFSQQGKWKAVDVQQLSQTRSSSEPFDLDAFRTDPEAKVFDPDATVTVDLTDEEWESFNRAIQEGREV